MERPEIADLDRRRFLKLTGLMAAGLIGGCAQEKPAPPQTPPAAAAGPIVALIRDSASTAPPAQWAIDQLCRALESRGVTLRTAATLDNAGPADLYITAASTLSPQTPESLSITPTTIDGRKIIAVQATDARALAYALSELSDRLTHGGDPLPALWLGQPITERPANRIRSIIRMFVSDVEDKAWFHDRAFWPEYFAMLAAQRFNRFNLSLSLGYDAPSHLRDTYFYFPYPFLLTVPGYNVRAVGLPDREREQNLQSLLYISQQAAAHGLDFQLGLWTHAYQWQDSPHANYVIEGLTPSTHAPYCRDALRLLLETCPDISGLTFRTHGESGVAEGSYDFWKALFSAITAAARPIRIDLHAKGITQEMIDIALAASPSVTVSPKFWAEHMGLPYLQSSIREEEMPKAQANNSFFSLSNGTRSFLRYSYGDLFRTDRKYGILHRVWPGTQRLLLWGDPDFAAGYGRIFNQSGADGVEYFDPLSFKGRKGSGLPDAGNRDGYADPTLRDRGGDWIKYLYTYRLLGRLSYNPDCPPEILERPLAADFGRAADTIGPVLSYASRILPLITSAHCPSAANANYWPEMYLNMSMVDPTHPGSYTDTPRPRVFGTVSSLDPQMFATADETADALAAGLTLSRYTPLDVADQLENWAQTSARSLVAADNITPDATTPAYRRLTIDARIAAGVGRFFAWKFRAAVYYHLFDRTGVSSMRDSAVAAYQKAADAWKDLSDAADGAYLPDLTFGPDPQLRGHWRDRVAAINADIAAVQNHPPANPAAGIAPEQLDLALTRLTEIISQRNFPLDHAPPKSFRPGMALPILLRDREQQIKSTRVWYRPMNQAARYQWQQMVPAGDSFTATIPADHIDANFPLQYYFEIGSIGLFPGLGRDFLGQPYYLIQPG